MSIAIGNVSSMLVDQSANAENSNKANSLTNSANNLSSASTEEELKEVLRDFESYFIEQMLKEMKETFTDDEDEGTFASQYTDLFMDNAIELIADELLDEVGDSMTKQLFEQMKRNYNIPSADPTQAE